MYVIDKPQPFREKKSGSINHHIFVSPRKCDCSMYRVCAYNRQHHNYLLKLLNNRRKVQWAHVRHVIAVTYSIFDSHCLVSWWIEANQFNIWQYTKHFKIITKQLFEFLKHLILLSLFSVDSTGIYEYWQTISVPYLRARAS